MTAVMDKKIWILCLALGFVLSANGYAKTEATEEAGLGTAEEFLPVEDGTAATIVAARRTNKA